MLQAGRQRAFPPEGPHASDFHHRDRRGIPDRRSGHARSALAHPRGDHAEGQAAPAGAGQGRDAPVGGRGRDRVCSNIKEAKEEVKKLRRDMIALARENGLRLASAATHPFADWREQEIYPTTTLPEHRRRPAAGGARQPDLRPARARRRRGPRDRDPPDEPRPLFPAAHPGAFDQLALLAGHGHRAEIVPLQGLRQVSRAPTFRTTSPAGASTRISSTC